MAAWLTVLGIGEAGYQALGEAPRQALQAATWIIGAPRQLALLPPHIQAHRESWPSPFALSPVLARRGQPTLVLASGDPMLFGVGASLARQLPADEFHVWPAPSSPSLAAARLGWALQEVELLSLVARPLAALNRHLQPGRRLLLLCQNGGDPARVAERLRQAGFGASLLTVLEHLGGADERQIQAPANRWQHPEVAALNLLAVECVADPGVRALSRIPGLPDDAYRHDGQLTKRNIRAMVLAHLGPRPFELLWDVGAGSGSIGIEWMRSDPSCRAIAIEANPQRQDFIRHNRDQLGVPALDLVPGAAPEALQGLEAPHAVFIGGGLTRGDTLPRCWQALRPGGRLVATAVTLQSEALLLAWQEQQGGELIRLALAQTAPLGGFEAWRPAMPITLLHAEKA